MLRRAGISIPELMVAMAVFAIFSVVLFSLMKRSTETWRQVESKNEAQNQLWTSENRIYRDLRQADPNEVDFARVTSSAGAGDALWMLSTLDPTSPTGNFRDARRDNTAGDPRWKRNVLYYLIRPNNHDTVTRGVSCGVDSNADGDAFCPHKFMIRKRINLGSGAPETLLTPGGLATYTTAPNGYDTSAMLTEPGVEQVDVLSTKLLWFEVSRTAGVFSLDLRALRLAEASKVAPVGVASLLNSRFTVQHQLDIMPNNFPR